MFFFFPFFLWTDEDSTANSFILFFFDRFGFIYKIQNRRYLIFIISRASGQKTQKSHYLELLKYRTASKQITQGNSSTFAFYDREKLIRSFSGQKLVDGRNGSEV